jgi:hypothetical protein
MFQRFCLTKAGTDKYIVFCADGNNAAACIAERTDRLLKAGFVVFG